MRFFIILAAFGLANVSGAPMQNFAFTTHGQGSHFTMMQKVIPQAMPVYAYAPQTVAIPQKSITITAPPGSYPGTQSAPELNISPVMMDAAAPPPTHRTVTLGNTAFGVGAAVKNIGYANAGQYLAAPQLLADKGLSSGPYAGISVGLANDKSLSAATLAQGLPMSHGAQTSYAPGPLGTFSPEKASLSSLPSKGFVAGTPIEMVTAQKTFFAGPSPAISYANSQSSPVAASQVGHSSYATQGTVTSVGTPIDTYAITGNGASIASPNIAAPPSQTGYGGDFAFAEKIFASAPAGLYAKPYATSPLSTKSMMIK